MAARLFLCAIRVIFCLFVFAKVGISDLNCGISSSGIPPPSHDRIINGYNISSGDHPWLVSLLYSKSNGTEIIAGFCGGTILSDRWILTAAHCTDRDGLAGYRFFYGAVNYKDAEAKTVKIKRSINHPEFHRPKRNLDIALAELSEPLTFNDKVQPICLVKKYKEVRHSMAVVIGWGSYSASPGQGPPGLETMPTIAQETNVPLANLEECLPNLRPAKKEYNICAGALNRGTEEGDSGSPLMVNKNGRWWQIGAVSRGQYLGKDWHNVTGLTIYSRVTRACQWIEETTSGEVKCHDMELH
ncbi:trypsin domain-containing protein [Ditylenchus destructor]|uniref:Trypsin domain-containing protein n=1 Tax=Ditylenchus destructor TaxID=166010 RepID=A0AAD4MMB2_9BILA|nr:trypsin domain-containing protein [Ditylenchus destructor]